MFWSSRDAETSGFSQHHFRTRTTLDYYFTQRRHTHIKSKKKNSGNFQHDHSTASTIEFFFYFYFSYSGKVVLK